GQILAEANEILNQINEQDILNQSPEPLRESSQQLGNRKVILEYNGNLSIANSNKPVEKSLEKDEGGLNFYKDDDIRRSNVSGKKAAETKDSRERLRVQLGQQAQVQNGRLELQRSYRSENAQQPISQGQMNGGPGVDVGRRFGG